MEDEKEQTNFLHVEKQYVAYPVYAGMDFWWTIQELRGKYIH